MKLWELVHTSKLMISIRYNSSRTSKITESINKSINQTTTQIVFNKIDSTSKTVSIIKIWTGDLGAPEEVEDSQEVDILAFSDRTAVVVEVECSGKTIQVKSRDNCIQITYVIFVKRLDIISGTVLSTKQNLQEVTSLKMTLSMISKQSQITNIILRTEGIVVDEVEAIMTEAEEATEAEAGLATWHSIEVMYRVQVSLLIRMTEMTTLVLVIPSLTSKTGDFS